MAGVAAPVPTSVTAQPTSSHPAPALAPVAKAPDPLAPLTPNQIKATATSTVSSAYAPQFTDLNNQANDVRNLDAKRAADSTTYSTWLASQGAALVQNNSQIMDHLETANQAAQITASNGIDSAVSQAGAATGTRGALLLGAMSAAGKGRVANAVTQGNTHAAIATQGTGDAVLNSLSEQSQVRTKQTSDADTALTTLRNAGQKLSQAKTADVAKEIARLGGVEISKAQIRENYGAALAKLNLTGQQAASLDNYRRGTLVNTATRNTNSAAAAASRIKLADQQFTATQDYRNFTERLAGQKLSDAEQRDLYQRLHGLGSYRQAAGHTTKPIMTPTQERASYGIIDQLNGEINQVAKQGNLTKKEAYHYILNGQSYTISVPGSKVQRVVKVKQAPNAEYLNAAYNLNTLGRINTGDLAALNRLGLMGVRQKYQVSDSVPAGYTNTAGNRRT